MKSRVTIADVAALAGVSPTTVSHVLSGNRGVGSGARERVMTAVERLGYRPSRVAQNLRTRRSLMVAVIVPDLTNEFYSVLVRGLADTVETAGYGTYVCNTDALPHREAKFVEDVLDRGVDGVVVAPIERSSALRIPAHAAQTPFVCLGDNPEPQCADRVLADEEAGSRAATAHLLALGAKRIAMIRGPRGSAPGRVAGYRKALADAGAAYDPDLVVDGAWTRDSGRAAMEDLMRRESPPDAVFCANDLMAIGAIGVLRRLHVDVPGEIALVGFDDIGAASLLSPSLTTVENPAYETGRRAGELLLSRMQGSYAGEPRTAILPCRLVVRESA